MWVVGGSVPGRGNSQSSDTVEASVAGAEGTETSSGSRGEGGDGADRVWWAMGRALAFTPREMVPRESSGRGRTRSDTDVHGSLRLHVEQTGGGWEQRGDQVGGKGQVDGTRVGALEMGEGDSFLIDFTDKVSRIC